MDICDRINSLTQMNNIIININNEDMYGDWMLLIGNESLENIAEDDGFYSECSRLFSDLVTDIGYWQ